MSLTKYYNLLIFHTSVDHVEVIGEDANVTNFDTNEAMVGMTVAEREAYTERLGAVRVLTVTYAPLTRLPPGTLLTGLERLDVNGCTELTHVPLDYPTSLVSLCAASTKLSSIPAVYASLEYLDVSNCKRISSISIPSLRTLLMSYSSVTEIALLTNLTRLVALHTKIVDIGHAPSLVVVLWTGVSNSTLTVDGRNTSLVHILTSGSTKDITSTNGLITSIVL